LPTFFALCKIAGKDLYYVNKKTYYSTYDLDEEEDDVCPLFPIVTRILEPTPHYSVELIPSLEKVKEITQNLYRLESMDKPIRAFSAYKSDELEAFSEKLGISFHHVGKKRTKKDMYEAIVQALS
jgi:hypothetical protein